jgi:hypothetical protein
MNNTSHNTLSNLIFRHNNGLLEVDVNGLKKHLKDPNTENAVINTAIFQALNKILYQFDTPILSSTLQDAGIYITNFTTELALIALNSVKFDANELHNAMTNPPRKSIDGQAFFRDFFEFKTDYSDARNSEPLKEHITKNIDRTKFNKSACMFFVQHPRVTNDNLTVALAEACSKNNSFWISNILKTNRINPYLAFQQLVLREKSR